MTTLDLSPAQLAHRAAVMATYPAPFRLEAAVILGLLLSFAAYLATVAVTLL